MSPSLYPGGLDTLATNKANGTATLNDHPTHHDDMADAINKIETELGVNPKGTYSDVVSRLNDAGFTTGMGMDFFGTNAQVPSGWIGCDGSAVTVGSGHIALRNFLIAGGNAFGTSGPDPLLPDMRGRDSIGAGTGPGLTARTLGQTLGEETHPLSTAELASHSHTQQGTFSSGTESAAHSHTTAVQWDRLTENPPAGVGNYVTGLNNGGALSTTYASGTESATHTHDTTIGGSTVAAGSGTAHNNMQPSTVVTKIIKL